jgi:hypothetical protein
LRKDLRAPGRQAGRRGQCLPRTIADAGVPVPVFFAVVFGTESAQEPILHAPAVVYSSMLVADGSNTAKNRRAVCCLDEILEKQTAGQDTPGADSRR